MITSKQAFHEVTQHDELATEALRKINIIQCYLDEVDCGDIAVLALDTLTRSILSMTSVTAERNKATAIYLCELLNANDISVKKGLADYREFLTQFDSVGSVKNQQPPWS